MRSFLIAASALAVCAASSACNDSHSEIGRGRGGAGGPDGVDGSVPHDAGDSEGAAPGGADGAVAGADGIGGRGGAAPSATGGAGGAAGADAGTVGSGGRSAPTPPPACASAATTLKAAGSCTDRLVGVALAANHLSEAAYVRVAMTEFNYVTPENEMKWDITEPTPGNFNFSAGDRIVDFAMRNGMKVRGHALLWHSQLPSWLDGLTATELETAIVRHVDALVKHYRGKVIAWDVVNEAFDSSGNLRSTVFSRVLGESFIELAFRTARAADPEVKLIYNEYDIESAYPKSDGVYRLLKGLKERGVPIDGVGMQMHTRTRDEDPPVAEFVANLDRFSALGLDVTLTEMEVRICSDGTLEKQKQRYHDLIAACVAHPGCGDITIWGIPDKYSFLNDNAGLACVDGGAPRPLLWDDNYQKKPAYDGVLAALLGR